MASATKSNIYFFFQTDAPLRERTRLKQFVAGIFKKEKRKLESLNFIFCTDDQILEINQQYLKHDYYTDIITFELSPKHEPIQGEVYISIDRVRENAALHEETFRNELHRVIFHGALHLCGYKDKSTKETEVMRGMEAKYLGEYFKGL